MHPEAPKVAGLTIRFPEGSVEEQTCGLELQDLFPEAFLERKHSSDMFSLSIANSQLSAMKWMTGREQPNRLL